MEVAFLCALTYLLTKRDRLGWDPTSEIPGVGLAEVLSFKTLSLDTENTEITGSCLEKS